MSEKKKIATREGFGKEIVALGKENPDILVVDIDIGKSCKTGDFRKELPQQYLNVGIAEQNGAGLAAGLATCGKVPFVVTYAVFGSLRMCEMIRQEVCYPNLNVKIACSHGGVTPANDGASHQSIEDMGILRTIPNMTVLMPADYWAARKLVRAAAQFDGPVYLRFTRDAIPVIYDEKDTFEIGKANLLKDGKDVAIIANGDTVRLALEAARTGGTATAVLNGANEAAVGQFLAGQLSFSGIAEQVAYAMAAVPAVQSPSLGDILDADQAAREAVRGHRPDTH
mgnify:CR=1 FL=1